MATIKSRMQKRQIEKFSNGQIENILKYEQSPYKELAIIVWFFHEADIVTASINESADDFGEWNDNWFTQENG